MWSLKAFLVTILAALVLAAPLYFFRIYLTKGNYAPASTMMLDTMEKKGVPNFSLPDLKGQEISLEQFKGKVIVLNFWASWCAPCVKEFPSLRRLADRFKEQLVVVAVSHDKTLDDLQSFLETFGRESPNFVILWDKDRSAGKLFGTQVLPETFIIGQDFRLLRKIAGEDEWDSPMAVRFFEDLLAL